MNIFNNLTSPSILDPSRKERQILAKLYSTITVDNKKQEVTLSLSLSFSLYLSISVSISLCLSLSLSLHSFLDLKGNLFDYN